MLKTTLHVTVISLCVLVGCGPSATTDATQTETEHHDDHGHDGEHDHDGHDEHGHDEHEGHDHDGHDEHEHGSDEDQPKSFSEGVSKVKTMGAVIVKAFKKESPNDAHDELHDIGHVIESLAELAKKGEIPSDGQTKIKEISEQLMDAFGKLDGVLHGGEMPDVDSLSKQIDESLAALQKLAPEKP